MIKRNLAVAMALTLAGSASAALVNVSVIDDEFTPDPVIALGDTIRWTWLGVNPHSTTSSAGQTESWDSGLQTNPFTFDHTFTNVGSFNYFCLLHGFDAGGGQAGGMAGTITVVPEPATLCTLGFGVVAVFRRRKKA